MKTSLPIVLLTVLAAVAPLQAQVISGHDITKSGRLQTGIGLDTEFGVTSFTSGNFTANTNTLGDSPGNNKQQTVFAFQVDSAWLTAYSNVDTVAFSFRVASINNGGGTPAPIEISLLAINDGTADPWDVAFSASLIASLGTVSGTAVSDHTINISSVLTAAATQPSATNNTIWFGLNGGFSNDNAANNVTLNMTNASFQMPELSVTAIPEPSAYALLSGMLALGWVMVRRRRSK
jgi:hypothetical protein